MIGPNAKTAVFSGGGSASLLPSYTVSLYEGIKQKVNHATYARGVSTHKQLPLLNGRLQTLDGKPGFTLKF